MKKKRWRHHHRHEVVDSPTNLEGVVLPVSDITVGSWMPERDGKGTPTEVHMMINSPASPPLLLRLKSRDVVDSLIVSLQNHRDDVFGDES